MKQKIIRRIQQIIKWGPSQKINVLNENKHIPSLLEIRMRSKIQIP